MASASLPSLSSVRQWKYDVFLSFLGRDTRKGFTSELHRRLKKKSIETFMAHPSIQVGDILSPTIVEAIKGSRFAIIILSPNYASSSLCLQELTAIYQCMEDKARILPLFFDLNYLETYNFEEAFTKFQESRMYTFEKLKEWGTVLTAVTNLSGRDLKDYETERELVKKIMEDIENNRWVDPEKKTFFGPGSNVNPGKQDYLVKREKFDNKNYIINVVENNNQIQQNRDCIKGDRGGDGGYNNNGDFVGVGGPAKGKNTFNYARK